MNLALERITFQPTAWLDAKREDSYEMARMRYLLH